MLTRALVLALMLLPLLGGRPAFADQGAVPSVTDPRYFAGANVPWLNWGCDFGCGSNGGASSASSKATLAEGFARLKAAGVHTVRWWVFPGEATQILRNASGPTGLNQSVYADFDAALALAEQYDLVYDFMLFSAPTHVPRSWIMDPGQRQRLGDALAPLFERYKNHPRILAWEIVNEPEWDTWNDKIPLPETQATVKLLASTIHAKTSTAVTLGSANLEGVPLWTGLGLNFYSPHWYDPMSEGLACARCSDVPTFRSSVSAEPLPIVLGEFYAGADKDALQRFKDFRAKGYAGAWAWSLFPDHTNDKLSIDLAAVTTFTSNPGAASPVTPPANPPASPPSEPAKPELLAGWVSPVFALPGENVSFFQDVRTKSDTSVLVDFEVYDSKDQKVWQSALDNQALSAATSPNSFSTTFTLPTSLAPGQYTVKTGLFAPGWGTMYAWSDWVGSFVVDTPPPPPPAPVPSEVDEPAPEAPGDGE